MATPVDELDLPVIDLDPAADRHRTRRQLAEGDSWLFRSQLGYLVTGYDDVVAILRDHRWHSAAALISDANLDLPDDDAFRRWRADRPRNILHIEGEDHQRLRSALMPFFTGRAIEERRPAIRAVASSLIGTLRERGGGEFVAEVCVPYPVQVMFDILGAGPEDLSRFQQVVGAAEAARTGRTRDPARIMADTERFDRLAEDLLDRARAGNQAPTGLLAALGRGIDDGTLSRGEARSLTQTALVAGTESTRSQLAAAVSLLARHPEQFQLLRERPELAATAAEEAMRYLGAVRGSARIAAVDVDHHDVHFPAGTVLIVNFSAVNRDAHRFDVPNRFDITRSNAGQHLTLGHGIHYCVGAHLARVELTEALAELATTVSSLDTDGDVVWRAPTSDFWGPAHLPVRLG